jgi:hypothetical protein
LPGPGCSIWSQTAIAASATFCRSLGGVVGTRTWGSARPFASRCQRDLQFPEAAMQIRKQLGNAQAEQHQA